MPVRNLSRIFAPRSVAVIGASPRPGTVGCAVLQNLSSDPLRRIYPVNPKHQQIGELACWPSIKVLPEVVDLAVICTPAATVPALVHECGERGVRGLVILSAGFREIGKLGSELESAVGAEAARYPGLRILGPNCLGFMAPHANLNTSFVDQLPPAGSVAFISQSGALCSAVLDWAQQENVGFSYVISLGNMLDIGVADLLDYLADDRWTDSVVLYAESITEARRFMSAARAFTRNKPIIAYKAGRFDESAKAASSHTGALAGVDSVYEAAFARAGVVRVFEIEDLFDCAELLARRRPVKGPRLAIVTNAGGPGVMATDALMTRHGTLAQLSEPTLDALNACLPPAWSHGNPVDIIGDATPERFRAAVGAVLADPGVDGLLVILSPQSMTDPTAAAREVIEAAARGTKPVLTSWMGGVRVAAGIDLLRQAGLPTYSSPEKAVRAFTYLVAHASRQEILYETPREVSVRFPLHRESLRNRLSISLNESCGTLSETASKQILQAYGVPVSATLVARNVEELTEHSRTIGYPVVLKLLSPDITHKSDVGGVELNVADQAGAATAFRRIMEQVRRQRPNARIDGVTVQAMVTHPNGRELIVGAKRDPVFGMVLLVGMGGTTAEIIQDTALELPPLSERLARRMLQSLRAWPLLQRYRGKPAVNIEGLVEVLIRLSYLVADFPEITEFDINPLLATPEGVIALDARIVLGSPVLPQLPRQYSHLAIRPYPEEFMRVSQLKDGSDVRLRPIKPEDEPLWHDLLQSCSPETIHRRFRYMFKATTHEMAARFCFIDYDRELAIVAEQGEGPAKKLLGVGRLVANSDHTLAEYAVLVGDAWQTLGLGSLLTDFCLDICRQWGVRTVQAETAADNYRMVGMFQRRGFASTLIPPDTITVVKQLV